MSIDINDFILKIRSCGLKKDKIYRLYCDTCNADRGYGSKTKANNNCVSCRSKKTFSSRALNAEYCQNGQDGNRRKYKAICSNCGKDRGLKRSRDLNRICSDCNSPPFKDKICKKIAINLRSRFSEMIRGKNKCGSAVKDLGCSIEEFRVHLESQFEPWMNWDNYGKYNKNRKTWHIDHIRPLSSFDLSNRSQLLKACKYTNLQPMLAKDNLSKGAKYE